jgi:hypothetical protein
VGLHQCPSERKSEGAPVRSLHVPSQVPGHPQTAAKVRGFSPTASGFTAETDCLLEGTGFEPSVPPDRSGGRSIRLTPTERGRARRPRGKTVGTDRGRDGRRYAAIRDIRRVIAFQWAVWGDCPILPDSLSGGALLAMRHSAAAPLFQTRIPQNSPGCSLPFIYDVRSSTARTHRLCCRRLSYASSPV